MAACIDTLLARASAAVLAAWLAPSALHAQTAPAPPLRAQSLGVSDNLYLLSGGGGGNTLMMTAETGTVLIDAGALASGPQLAEIASTISDQRVTTVVYSHAHVDHTGGTTALRDAPRIIAHERTAAALKQAGVAEHLVPTERVTESLTLFEGPDRIELRYFGRGHTGGDLVVTFPGKRLAYLGDLFPGKMLPAVDRENGGSWVELPQTLARAVAALSGVARIIPGHASPPPGSPLGRWITIADLQEYADFTRDLVTAARDGLSSGRGVDDVAANLTLPTRYAAYDLNGLRQAIQAISEEIAR